MQRPPHPDRRLLVFCVRLPCAACSRMLFFSSSRWPLVVSRGTLGALPGPLWLWLSSGTGLMVFVRVFVMRGLRFLFGGNADGVDGVPGNSRHSGMVRSTTVSQVHRSYPTVLA